VLINKTETTDESYSEVNRFYDFYVGVDYIFAGEQFTKTKEINPYLMSIRYPDTFI